MFHDLDRRSLLRFGAAGAALLPARTLAQVRGFTHSVASGDPAVDAVLLWTRFVGGGDAPAPLRAEVAEEPGFGRIVAVGEGSTSPESDWCARVLVGGLVPGRRYFYRFRGPDGAVSETGRTRTLPQGRTARFNVAVFSCSNKGFGFFNAYGHAARRDDIDLVVHVGDYLYEYRTGVYPLAERAVAGRETVPATEIVALGDYRARYADYRRDPDLQALHRNFPVVSIWDDHELTNDAWREGAENHQPDEGDWQVRKRVALQAYREWLPISERDYVRYDAGDLVSLLVLESRLQRDRQLSVGEAAKDGMKGLIALRDGPWSDAKRTLLGADQERWVADNLKASASTARWNLVAQQLVMGNISTPKDAAKLLRADATPRIRGYVEGGVAAASVGLPQNLDGWGGYMPARARLLQAAQAADANLVVVSGDSHNAWACDLAEGGKPAGVEFAGHGVTSPGFEAALGADPAAVAGALVAANPELKWADTSRRGYLTVSFTADAARAEWVFMDTVLKPSLDLSGRRAAIARRGRNRLELL